MQNAFSDLQKEIDELKLLEANRQKAGSYLINGKYARRLYPLLKACREEGTVELSSEQMALLMRIPETYETRNIMQRIIQPSLEELKDLFGSLELEKLREGMTIVGYRFTFSTERLLPESMERYAPVPSLSALKVWMKENGVKTDFTKDLYDQLIDRIKKAPISSVNAYLRSAAQALEERNEQIDKQN